LPAAAPPAFGAIDTTSRGVTQRAAVAVCAPACPAAHTVMATDAATTAAEIRIALIRRHLRCPRGHRRGCAGANRLAQLFGLSTLGERGHRLVTTSPGLPRRRRRRHRMLTDW